MKNFLTGRYIHSILLLVTSLMVHASQPILTLTHSDKMINISSKTSYLKGGTSEYGWEEIQNGSLDNLFIENTKDQFGFGNGYGTIWHKIQLTDKDTSGAKWLLVIDNHHLDSISLYSPTGQGDYIVEKSGRLVSYDDRKYKYNTFALELPLLKGETQTYYLKISSYILNYPLEIIRYDEFTGLHMKRNVAMGVLFGFLLMIVLYNLFLFYSERDKNYIFYITYVAIAMIKIADMKGYMDMFYQGPLSFMRTQTPGITPFMGLAMVLFSVQILDFKRNLPKAYSWTWRVMAVVTLVNITLISLEYKLYSSILNQIGTLLLTIYLYICAVLIYRKGYRPARYYVIAVSAFFISIFVYTLCLFGIIPLNHFTDNLIDYGAGLEMLLFSLALADKIREYKLAKNEAESTMLKTLQKNEELILNQNKVLEQKVAERTKDLVEEKEKSDNLLLNILPGEIAEELKNSGHSQARQFEKTSVIFTDFVNFTGVSEQFSPPDLLREINHCFTHFDNIISKYGLEKIKTIGDAYLAVSGVPLPEDEHAFKTLHAAKEILTFMKDYQSKGGVFQIRIGVHSGPLIAGIVGVKKFAYDIWGDTVNTAARMEQNSESGKINISGATYRLISHRIKCTYRGKLPAKNKGEIDMYFVDE